MNEAADSAQRALSGKLFATRHPALAIVLRNLGVEVGPQPSSPAVGVGALVIRAPGGHEIHTFPTTDDATDWLDEHLDERDVYWLLPYYRHETPAASGERG